MTRRRLIARLLAGLILLAGACNSAGGPASGGGLAGLKGTITADGSSTVFPISQAIAELFNGEAPQVKVSVGTSGTGGGFKKFCAGETDISDASRLIKEEEKQACASKSIEYDEIRVAIDGLSVLVNPSNDWVECLTVAELKKIWEPDSTVKNWSHVRAGFPNKPISLYGPGTDSGTFDYFTDEVVGEEGASRSDFVASEDDNVLVQGIAGDHNALGYFGFAYYEQNRDKLETVRVDGGDGCIEPTRETINSGRYAPLSRPLFIYVAKKAAARTEVSEFVDFYLESVNGIIADVGYIAVPANILEEESQGWKAFKG